MIERAIENWLTNTNERNYQIAFCQTLLERGHKIIYVSPHSIMEQGKDIITIDKNSEYCAYQLKTGDIDISKWRKISGEIRELIELPIIHPSVNPSRLHKSFLVTNGEISDPVRIQISQINDDNKNKHRNYSYLDVITFRSLLKEFLEFQGKFIPTELEDFKKFLEIFLGGGSDFFQKEKYFEFIKGSILKISTNGESAILNSISSSIILTAYILKSYQDKKNHYALFEAWVVLYASIIQYISKKNLQNKNVQSSLELIEIEIVRNLTGLKNEALERKDFLEGSGPGDGVDIYRARTTIIIGSLSALELYLNRKKDNSDQSGKLLDLIKNNINVLWFWGESAFPFFFCLIKYLESKNEKEISNILLSTIMQAIIECNALRSNNCFANPYYPVQNILEVILHIESEDIDFGQFSGSSYNLEPIVLMLAKRNGREILENHWKKLSHIYYEEFRFENTEDLFSWRSEIGTTTTIIPRSTQSWTDLVKEINNIDDIPDLFLNHIKGSSKNYDLA